MVREHANGRPSLLLALAPWPVLVRIVTSNAGPWCLWGSVPDAVAVKLADVGVVFLADPLPAPFHRHEIPAVVSGTRWARVVVPALGHPLPTRWPVLRHLAASLTAPLFVSTNGALSRVEHGSIPAADAYTWALDRVLEPAAEPGAAFPSDTTVAVRADLLGDVVLACPALDAFSRVRPTTVVTRTEWVPWLEALAAPRHLRTLGISIDPWHRPSLPPCERVVDMSPAESRSPLTRAIARSVPAVERFEITADQSGASLSIRLACALGVVVECTAARSGSGPGLLLPGASSWERALPTRDWANLVRSASAAFDIRHWTVAGLPAAAAEAFPGMRLAPHPLSPTQFLEFVRQAPLVIGTSSGLAHVAAVAGARTIVVEHPTTVSGLYRVPSAHAQYLRSAAPWWSDSPSPSAVEQAFGAADTYGFGPDELQSLVERALGDLRSMT